MDLTTVLLPGNMCDGGLWHGGDGVLHRTLPRPIVDADLTRDDTIAAMAARTLGSTPGDLLLVGFSMGAIVALDMVRQTPARIAGLVLMGLNASADLPERAHHRPVQQAEVRELADGLRERDRQRAALLTDERHPHSRPEVGGRGAGGREVRMKG